MPLFLLTQKEYNKQKNKKKVKMKNEKRKSKTRMKNEKKKSERVNFVMSSVVVVR
jgi:hypothetical protein